MFRDHPFRPLKVTFFLTRSHFLSSLLRQVCLYICTVFIQQLAQYCNHFLTSTHIIHSVKCCRTIATIDALINYMYLLFPAVASALLRNHLLGGGGRGGGKVEYRSSVSQLNRHLIPITPMLIDYSKKQYHSKKIQTKRWF